MKSPASPRLRSHGGLTERNAIGRARWTYLRGIEAACPDLREPFDALVADDRLRLKRVIAREWLAQRAAARAQATPQPAPPSTQSRRLCRVLAFHAKRR